MKLTFIAYRIIVYHKKDKLSKKRNSSIFRLCKVFVTGMNCIQILRSIKKVVSRIYTLCAQNPEVRESLEREAVILKNTRRVRSIKRLEKRGIRLEVG